MLHTSIYRSFFTFLQTNIMQKITLTFVLLLFVSSQIKAQLSGPIGLSFSIGPTTGYTLHSSFNKFRQSYNEVNKDNLSKAVGKFSPEYGYKFLARFNMETVTFFVGYSWTQAQSHGELFNGKTERIFRRTHRMPLYGGAGLRLGNGGSVELFSCGGRSEIRTGYKYSDGTVSYGQDKFLNGTYTAFSGFFGVAYEQSLKGKLENISWRAEFMLPLLPKGVQRSFTDWTWPRTGLAGYPTELSTDLVNGSQDYVSNRMRMFQFSILYTIKTKQIETE
jgi:hypothetical protein